MMLYISALGFSAFNTKEKAEGIVSDIIANPNTRYISNYKSDEIKVEYYKEYGTEFGLIVRGALNQEEELTVYSLIPYAIGSVITDTHEIDVVKGERTDVYNAFCEESRSGTPVSFFLQNVIDYLEIEDQEDVYIEGVRLVAFSVEGTVILPIDKDDTDLLLEEEEDVFREELLEKARQGDEDAIQILEDEALESSEILQERLKDEDLLSILEGFFVPLGDSEDIYSFLGTIEEVTETINKMTEERIYILSIKCMSLYIDVYINSADITGIPSAGMRFKGTSWVHGLIEFEFNGAYEEE
ncbi:MAG: hypothetical protein CVV02_08390 [Firmicutes bacterium HGW-Firmicutes-7]|nr:MAG: hypothetical protein CVV02_08390 [Firmicutes bacterium HGW-Firmicutes-7]